MKKEWIARSMLVLGLVFAGGVPILGWRQHTQSTVLHAHMAETGGWTPENLTAEVGKPLHLRLTSNDVTHGFAIGKSDQLLVGKSEQTSTGLAGQDSVDVVPGEMTDVTLVFDKPGKYTFYCTRWCSVNHWRMRGTIEVTDPNSNSTPDTIKPPLYVSLGLDLDADHKAFVTPAKTPSAWRGAMLKLDIPSAYKSQEYYRTHTPIELWTALRKDSAYQALSDQDIWDLVAWSWQNNITPDEVRAGKQLFSANCAACHGENGRGDGVFAEELAGSAAGVSMGEGTQKPADFTDASKMLSASPAHLQGKIIRGGMGTGMPYWGPIFKEDQLWELVAYLWTFQFNLEVKP